MKKLKVWQLVLGLVLVISGTTLFVVAVSGGFSNQKAVLSFEYNCGDECSGEYMELKNDEYGKLVEDKKSFMVFVDQGGCTTADRLRGFVRDWGVRNGVKVYRIMFEDMKETSLHDSVKYYPSVAVISSGKVIGFLRADSDEDSDAYNKYEAFEKWVEKYLKKS